MLEHPRSRGTNLRTPSRKASSPTRWDLLPSQRQLEVCHWLFYKKRDLTKQETPENLHCTRHLLMVRIILALVMICTFVSPYVTCIQNTVKNKMDKISLWKGIEPNCPWKKCFQQLRKVVCYFTCGPNCTWSNWSGLAFCTCFTDIMMSIQVFLTV